MTDSGEAGSTGGVERPGVLGDIRVLDLTRNLAGPYCTMLLADLGADVVKIEKPGTGDDTRAWAPPLWGGVSATFLAANRNKRSVAVDLDTPEGAEIVKKLALEADVLIESFRPGSLDKRGLGYETLRTENPRLVYCSISGYGTEGPLAGWPGYDPVLQAFTGIMSVNGEPDGPADRLGVAAIDLGSGLWAALGIFAALTSRAKTGVGSRVETSLFEVATWWLSYHIAGYFGTGKVPHRMGTKAGFVSPYEVFDTTDVGIMVCAANDGLFGSFMEELGLPELANDVRFLTNPLRVENREELREIIAPVMAKRSASDWYEQLSARKIPCSPVRTVADLVVDEQLEAIGLMSESTHPTIGPLSLVGLPIRHDGKRAVTEKAPPLLGEHTDEVLRDLGLEPGELVKLRAAGVVG